MVDTASSNYLGQVRKTIRDEYQMKKLKDYLKKPIKHFDVVLDKSKLSNVWKYYGELAFKDPISRDIHVIDATRFYCLKCIQDCQKLNCSTSLLDTHISWMKAPVSDIHDHLLRRHGINIKHFRDNSEPNSRFKKIEESKTTIEAVESDESNDSNKEAGSSESYREGSGSYRKKDPPKEVNTDK